MAFSKWRVLSFLTICFLFLGLESLQLTGGEKIWRWRVETRVTFILSVETMSAYGPRSKFSSLWRHKMAQCGVLISIPGASLVQQTSAMTNTNVTR